MGTIEKVETLEKVAELYLKGYKPAEIARDLDLSPSQVRSHIKEYKEYIAGRVNEDPEFLDRLQENTLEALDRFDTLLREAWQTYETAKSADMLNQQINGMKLIKELEIERAKLLQLMGAKVDSGMMARMQKAEQVNEIVSRIIKEVVAQCDHCKAEVMPRLAEAFAMMNKHDEAVDIHPIEDDIEDVEIVEEVEEEEDHSNMMLDVVAYD